MPKPYSADLRERVLLADEAGLPPATVAQRFGVGLATVYLWRQQARAAGRRCAKPHGGGRARGIDPGDRPGGSTRRARRSCGRWWQSGTIARWTNTESCWRYAAAGRRSAGRPCAGPCGGSGYGQKKTLRASARDRADIQAERAVFRERVRQLDAKSLVFLDESGITTAMTPLYARARRGERAHGSAPGGWRRLSVLGALSGEGIIAAMSIQAATTTRVFLAFLQAVLIPELRRRHPGVTVLMDNLSAHKPKAVETALTTAGFKLLYLPRHSPDLSPIEPGWSRLKCVLRAAEARTPEALDAALAPALDSITPPTLAAGSTIAVTRFQTAVTRFQTDRKTALRKHRTMRTGAAG